MSDKITALPINKNNKPSKKEQHLLDTLFKVDYSNKIRIIKISVLFALLYIIVHLIFSNLPLPSNLSLLVSFFIVIVLAYYIQIYI